ncbi:MAG: hypothetical protein H0T89_07570 [Deltaproteobacteria bacterium]|nr:hypothetical protein [Deltaproteobacteria bacterium]MDQ3297136.1 hypothetical protein [Myxococcota bacterium]
MEAVDPQAPAIPAVPKLTIEKFADAGIACLKFVGTIDEAFEGKKLGTSTAGDVLVVDLGGVKKISSFGIREWVDFIGTASKQVRSVILIECAPKVVDQLNMVANFAGTGQVFSFYAPFRCDYCDSEHRVLLQLDRDHAAIKSMKLADRPCPTCKDSMYFDEDGATFFSYVLGQDRFELEPAVATFLAAKLDYAVADLNRKLRVDKVIEGRTTYLRFAGDLDRTFPRDKLAEGLEGVVVADLVGLGRIEPAGAAEWRAFVQQTTPLVELLCLANVPPTFLEKLATRPDLGAKGQVLSLTLPYTCGGCGTTSAQLIDVSEHHEVLKFATAPELRCLACKHAMQCVAGEGLMALLPELPKPTASTELVKSIGMLRERAASQHKRPSVKSAVLSAQSGPTPGARSVLLVPFLAALLAIVVAAGAYLVYQRVTKPAVKGAAITARSTPVRPAWIVNDTPGAAACTDTVDKGLSCVGVSSPSAHQDDAEDEAADAAYEAAANAIAVRIVDPAWQAGVPSIYAASRDAKLTALDRDPTQTSARRDVREARHAVAQALRTTGGSAVPAAPTARYWEQTGGDDGRRTIAFAQVVLSATELASLVQTYRTPATALGATVVPAFPLVAWRYPRAERGAIITALASGPLQDLGLAEQYIVLAVGGRDIGDASAFAQLVNDEHTQLVERGGTLRLKVQTPDPAPREFAKKLEGKPVEPTGSGKRPPRGSGTDPAHGGVNVWDKFDRGKGRGREDPNQ